jgi:hypothetical protein
MHPKKGYSIFRSGVAAKAAFWRSGKNWQADLIFDWTETP